MATLHWDRVRWPGFVAALEAYKEHFSGRSREDFAYLRCRKKLEGRPVLECAARSRDIVKFLNDWACRVNSTDTPIMLAGWIRENADRLERLRGLTIVDDELPDAIREIQALYDSLMATGRAAVPNWSDAAASKVLHQLIPELFVMWDNNIKPFAADYGDFMLEMHRLGQRLIDESPFDADEVEERLQAHLRYATRKTIAKYLDEHNWYVVVGAAQVARR
jgi:hypothetical protein